MLRRNFTSFPMSALAQNLEKLEQANAAYNSFKKGVAELLGPSTAAEKEKLNLLRQKYGQPRENLARDVFEQSVLHISVAEKDAEGRDVVRKVESAEYFKGTPVEEMISYMQKNMPQMMQYHWTVYLGFFFDNPYDSNIFGGIWPMILGTFYLDRGRDAHSRAARGYRRDIFFGIRQARQARLASAHVRGHAGGGSVYRVRPLRPELFD